MKAKKIVIGAVSAAMLSLSVCSIAPVFAAGETVQISVSKTEAKAGETFSVDVSLSNVPSSGIQSCDFAIKYDSSLITIDSVKAGELANTAAVEDDPSSSLLSIFDSSINNDKGLTSLIWSTSLDDSSYWMNSDGVFCTVTGTLSADAKGTIPLEIVPASRDTFTGSNVPNEVISVGYVKNKEVIRYDVKTDDGAVTVSGGEGTTGNTGLKGDVNEDGKVSLADAVLIMQALSNPNNYKISAQGQINGDVINNDGITPLDALEIQKFDLGMPSALDS
ncbi:MAG: cohesin domain-containing protein [Ruminococcus flavefaciens]|nr:cohesin domain-containing protein [Ruminococcus flavefaciens]